MATTADARTLSIQSAIREEAGGDVNRFYAARAYKPLWVRAGKVGPEAAMLLERLGFTRCLSFEKRRQTWKLDDCRIDIEELPHLGQFVEIEGRNEEAVMKLRDALGLAERPLVKNSYVAMLTSHMQERGMSGQDVMFPREAVRMAKAG